MGSEQSLRVWVDFKNARGFKPAAALGRRRVFKRMGWTVGFKIAHRLAARMRVLLQPGKGGASGLAAQNIFVGLEKDGSIVIYEGEGYEGGFFLRHGRKPSKDTSKAPPYKAIIDWVIAKGIALDFSGRPTPRMTKYGGLRAKTRSKPSRPFKKDMKGIALAIAQSIRGKGMESLKTEYPFGQSRFEYHLAAMIESGGAERLVKPHEMRKAESLVLQFFREGREGKELAGIGLFRGIR